MVKSGKFVIPKPKITKCCFNLDIVWIILNSCCYANRIRFRWLTTLQDGF